MSLHPRAEELADFASGQMGVPESLVLENHLNRCDRCRKVLEDLPDDPLTVALRLPEVDGSSSVPTWTGSIGAADAEGRWEQLDEVPPELADHPRYRVLEMLGRGGMGLVFKAEHRILNRLVALKVIRPRLLTNPAAVERFAREVEAAARLSHPNIVTALDADQAGGVHFFIMEFVAGVNLAEFLARHGPFSVGEACDICRQVAQGLQHAHEQNMVHRDIKPQNLMRTPAGQVKILDFGLAHLVSKNLGPGWPEEAAGLLGSPDYIAPEQVRNAHAVNIRADLYSLGCTLFHLLAREVPFPGLSNAQKVAAHLEQTPRLLNAVRGDVPQELARLVFRLLAKGPEERLQTPLVGALAPFVPVALSVGPGSTRVLMGHSDQVGCVAFSPFGFMLASGSHDQTAILWEARSGQELAVLSRHTDAVHSVAFSPDGRTLATAAGDGQVRLWDVVRRRKRLSLEGHAGAVRAVVFHPDGRTLASAGDDRQIRIWDAASGQEIATLSGHADRVTALGFSRDGQWLASGSRDRTVILWDFAHREQRRILDGFPRTVSALSFHPRGRILAVASSGVHLRAIADGNETSILPTEGSRVPCLVCSPDGALVACASGNCIHLWRPARRSEPRILEGHHGRVAGLAFSPDSCLLASASADRTVRIWNLLLTSKSVRPDS